MLRSFPVRLAWFDLDPLAARRAVTNHGGIVVESVGDLVAADVVIVAVPSPHAECVATFTEEGVHVVSLADDPTDIAAMLSEHATAKDHGVSVVVGAGVSPGLTGVLAHHLGERLSIVDEIHVAMHGTAGPACARRHHDALAGRAVGWHDGEWVERPGGSGRELCWFPEPIGPADCYRAAVADPLLLHLAFPDAERISARVSATRRDRLTARLPMLSPPHRDGDRGGVRVEVRGAAADGARVTHLVGAEGRTADLAGAVAGSFALACAAGRTAAGVVVAGADHELSTWMLRSVADAGVRLREYTGVASSVVAGSTERPGSTESNRSTGVS